MLRRTSTPDQPEGEEDRRQRAARVRSGTVAISASPAFRARAPCASSGRPRWYAPTRPASSSIEASSTPEQVGAEQGDADLLRRSIGAGAGRRARRAGAGRRPAPPSRTSAEQRRARSTPAGAASASPARPPRGPRFSIMIDEDEQHHDRAGVDDHLQRGDERRAEREEDRAPPRAATRSGRAARARRCAA